MTPLKVRHAGLRVEDRVGGAGRESAGQHQDLECAAVERRPTIGTGEREAVAAVAGADLDLEIAAVLNEGTNDCDGPIELPGAISPPCCVSLPRMLEAPLRMPPFIVISLFKVALNLRPPALSVVPPPTVFSAVSEKSPEPFLVSVPVPVIAPA